MTTAAARTAVIILCNQDMPYRNIKDFEQNSALDKEERIADPKEVSPVCETLHLVVHGAKILVRLVRILLRLSFHLNIGDEIRSCLFKFNVTFSRIPMELESCPYMIPIWRQTCPMSFSTLEVSSVKAVVWLERMVLVMVSNLAARLSSICPPDSSISSET